MLPHGIVDLNFDIIPITSGIEMIEYPRIKLMRIFSIGTELVALTGHVSHYLRIYHSSICQHLIARAVLMEIQINVHRQTRHGKDRQVNNSPAFDYQTILQV